MIKDQQTNTCYKKTLQTQKIEMVNHLGLEVKDMVGDCKIVLQSGQRRNGYLHVDDRIVYMKSYDDDVQCMTARLCSSLGKGKTVSLMPIIMMMRIGYGMEGSVMMIMMMYNV